MMAEHMLVRHLPLDLDGVAYESTTLLLTRQIADNMVALRMPLRLIEVSYKSRHMLLLKGCTETKG